MYITWQLLVAIALIVVGGVAATNYFKKSREKEKVVVTRGEKGMLVVVMMVYISSNYFLLETFDLWTENIQQEKEGRDSIIHQVENTLQTDNVMIVDQVTKTGYIVQSEEKVYEIKVDKNYNVTSIEND